MRRKLVLALVLFLVLALVAAGTGAWWVYRRGVPALAGERAAGVRAVVEIYRDDYAVPHIFAQTEEDLFYAQGYVMAQDRLWQMDLTRRAVSGRLAEIFGPDFAAADQFLRTIGFVRAARESEAFLTPEAKQALEAFARGINDYIAGHRRNLPIEFTILGYQPDPWTTTDSLAIGKYMAWELGGNMQTELFLLALVDKLGPERARTLFPAASPEDLTIIQSAGTPVPGPWWALAQLLELADLGRVLGISGEDLGSNNWVVGGQMTASGRPMLANDMHLAMGAPSIWYQNHLVVPGRLNVTGVMFPGVPGVIVGHNERVAWGVTNVGPDVQDLYVERPNPANPYQFEYNGRWENATVIREEIRVKGRKEPVVKEVVITRHGPIISDVVTGVSQPLSLRWTAYERTRELEAVLGFMRARNWDDFKKALEHFMAPAQNFVFADIDGTIAYRANGLFPVRNKGDGLLPVPGWTDEYEWKGWIPWDEVPQVMNPPEGFIVTANNRVVGDDYPYFLSHQWALPYRAMSIRQELEGKKGLTLADMEKIQTDWKNLQAAILYPIIGRALEGGQWSPEENRARQVLARWSADPRDLPDAAGPAIFHTLYLKMLWRTFQDELGELYPRFLEHGSAMNVFDTMLRTDSPWFDDVTTPEKETRDGIIRLAFRDTVAELAGKLGKDPEKWEWGRLHTITFAHPLGRVKPLDRLFNRGPFPYGGSKITAGAASYSLTDPFAVKVAAPWRYAVDLADLDHGGDVLAIGISGQPASPHYQDQMQLWLTGRYKTMWFDEKEIRTRFAGNKTILRPASSVR
ncbi:MAG: penicillin acylase family protein [Firmicutes bacterium]|nr:penicillin acylase family protein [Bacillota bacterium]